MLKVVGDFQLKEKLGKGNYADVYLGCQKATGDFYAIKVISKETFSEHKLLLGLESEIKIMKEFSHINIIQMNRYFSSEKNFYLVLEYCKGGDLSKYIKKCKKLSEEVSMRFLKQLAEGLNFLYLNNFIHRDLKPANVLLSEASPHAVLKLADFGFAKHLSCNSLAQTRCGTPLYMAPEILEGKEYDSKVDTWSVGCIYYEMLVGACPFKGINELDLLNNIRTKEFKAPGDIALSKSSLVILAKLLDRNSSRRLNPAQLLEVCVAVLDSTNSKDSREDSQMKSRETFATFTCDSSDNKANAYVSSHGQPSEEDFVIIESHSNLSSRKYKSNEKIDHIHTENIFASESEENRLSSGMLYSHTLHRYITYMSFVHSIVSYADGFVREGYVLVHDKGSRAKVLAAYSLFNYALKLLRIFLQTVETALVESSAQTFLSCLCQNIVLVYDEILHREQNCIVRMSKMLYDVISKSDELLIVPQAEYFILNGALDLDYEGFLEESMGNLIRALLLYETSETLVNSLAITMPVEDTRKIQSSLKLFCASLDRRLFSLRTRLELIDNEKV